VASEVKPADPAGGAATTEIIVRGPSIEQPKQAIEINIAVGPTPAMAERGMTHGLADDAFAAPTPKIVIGAGDANAPTTDERLY
jgi:hypothetical protein